MSKINLKIKRGDTFAHRFSLFKDSENKVPFNLSDVARIDLQAIADDEVVLSLSTTNQTLILKDNSLIMLVSKKLTERKEWETANYDVQITYNDNIVKTIFSGKITLIHDVTGSIISEDETSFERAIQFAMDNKASEIIVHKESMNIVFGVAVKGDRGDDGATFTPHIQGTMLTFTNDKGLDNPEPVDLKGSNGDQGDTGKSAYEIAVQHGYQGSEQEWIGQLATNETIRSALNPINQSIEDLKGKIGGSGGLNLLDDSEKEVTALDEYIVFRRSPELKKLILNKTVTLSFDIKVAVAGDVTVYSSNQSGVKFYQQVNLSQANKWERKSITVTPRPHDSTPDNPNATIEFFGTYNTGRIITIRNVKLEYGETGSLYSPSVGDFTKPLSDLLSDIDIRLKALEKRFNTPNPVIGKNYLLNSKYFSAFRSNNSELYPLESGKDGKGQWISGTSKGKYEISTFSELLNNGTYFAENLTQQEITISAYFNPTHQCSIRLDNSSVVVLQPNQWTRVSVTQRGTRMAGIYVSQVGATVGSGDQFKLYHERWKVEKGRKATDWIEE
ncbi:hypothetical protein [Pasteurella sp. PK-2025]|uniref:hypothetical protein n=2 Tax=Pasteurella TaxID=745 RepID=UPI003C78C2FB